VHARVAQNNRANARSEGAGEGAPAVPEAAAAAAAKTGAKRARDDDNENNGTSAIVGENGNGSAPHKEARTLVQNTTPHRVLLAQCLPEECTGPMLESIFKAAAGVVEVRRAPGSNGVAFIEFENEVQAGTALRLLHGYQLTATASLNLTYSS
jgi:U2 small nuclear ribonucleoprotein B''